MKTETNLKAGGLAFSPILGTISGIDLPIPDDEA